MTYLLIHGAYHGKWCWEEVSKILEDEGHEVHAIDLPGLGEDRSTEENIGIKLHSKAIIDYIEKNDLQNLHIVGHSYAGILLTHIYPLVKKHLSAMIFISALILPDQTSVFDFISPDRATLYREMLAKSENWLVPIDYETARDKFFEYHTEEEAKQLYKRLRLQPGQTYNDRANSKEFLESDIKKIFIYCEKDKIVRPEQQDEFVDRVGADCIVIKIPTGHDPMLSHAELLVEKLMN